MDDKTYFWFQIKITIEQRNLKTSNTQYFGKSFGANVKFSRCRFNGAFK